MFNLLEERWIPVRRASGLQDSIAPHEITDLVDPPVHLSSPRPDFDGALAQFLIGLIQTCAAPQDTGEWRARMRSPPASCTLQSAFAPYRDAFHLFGAGPRFLQDLDLSDVCDENSSSVEQLLIEAPGEQTRRQNTDLFVKRDRVGCLSLPMAATALLTLQLNAPSGGRGYRTSLRGGGPLTTLVVGRTLWETVWLNVLTREDGRFPEPSTEGYPQAFPWLARCRTSEIKGSETLPSDIDPLQMFWATPRRVRLCPPIPGKCALTGVASNATLSRYNTIGLGVNYAGPFEHPLTPYWEPKPGELPIPVKGGSSAATFMRWPALALGAPEIRQARCVRAFFDSRRYVQVGSFRLWVTGFEMDNAKALRWVEATTPLPSVADERRAALADITGRCVKACVEVEAVLRAEVRNALARRPKDLKGDLGWVNVRYEAHLEAKFFARVASLTKSLADDVTVEPELEAWLDDIGNAARSTFDQCPQVSADLTGTDLARLARARSGLWRSTSSKSKKIRQTLGLPETR